MSKKTKYKIVSIPINDQKKLVEMGYKVRDGFAKIKYYACDSLFYEEYDEQIIVKKI